MTLLFHYVIIYLYLCIYTTHNEYINLINNECKNISFRKP